MSKFDKRFILVALAIVAAIYCTFFATTSWGASVNKPVSVTNSSRLDSIRAFIYDDGVIADSCLMINTTGDTTFVLDDASDWDILYKFYWDGTGTPYPEWEYVKYTAGAATATVYYDSVAYYVSGGGSDTIVFYALDTSGTDTVRQDVKLTVYNASGAEVVNGWTNSSGNKTLYLDAGTYTIVGRATGYIWNSLSYTVSANADSVPVLGYNQVIGNPSSANLSRVYGWVKDITDQAIAGASVTITRNSTAPVVDSSGTGSVVISPQAIVVYTDTAGYWFADLRRTANYDDTTRGFYDIEGTWDTKTLFKINKLYIPGSGNVNLGDTLANRVN